eukprot:TRINITY_DN103115_c0_g1_i1.p1 TRINITY_DN103115_c0_g1~~TRINITY_DN103115_c0_g1_i1.p1  ORF type:complete len:310 (-),score=71.28 TRINITY_DN103115_c0_g1_i1:311-1240(-)
MPLGSPPPGQLWPTAAIGSAELGGQDRGELQDIRGNAHEIEDLSAHEAAAWQVRGLPAATVHNAWGWQPQAAARLLSSQSEDALPPPSGAAASREQQLPAAAAVWVRSLQSSDEGVAAADQASPLSGQGVVGKATKGLLGRWRWSAAGWHWSPEAPSREDLVATAMAPGRSEVERAALRAVARVAGTAAQIADQQRLSAATLAVSADPTMPAAAVSGWTPGVVDSAPGVFNSMPNIRAWQASKAVEAAAHDVLPGGQLAASRRLGRAPAGRGGTALAAASPLSPLMVFPGALLEKDAVGAQSGRFAAFL